MKQVVMFDKKDIVIYQSIVISPEFYRTVEHFTIKAQVPVSDFACMATKIFQSFTSCGWKNI